MRSISARPARAHGRVEMPRQAVQGITKLQACRLGEPAPADPHSPAGPCRRRARRGSLLVVAPVVIALMAVLGVVAVDWGRIQLARGELQAAVDAAALHAVTGARVGTHEERAAESLADNRAGGRPIDMQLANISLGQWNSSTQAFDADAAPADAVSITAHATVDLYFGGFVGVSEVTVKATAVAGLGESVWGLTGIDSVRLRHAQIDSYQPGVGPYASTKRQRATVSSNGNISLDGSSAIGGDAFAGPGYSVSGGSVTGSRGYTQPRVFDPVTPAEWAGGFDNGPLAGYLSGDGSLSLTGNSHLTLPAGNYVVNDLRLLGTSELEATGRVTIFVTGAVSIGGTMRTIATSPDQLRIRVASTRDVRIHGTPEFAGDIYAPTSRVRFVGNPDFFGRVVGRTLDIRGVDLHHDENVERFVGRGNFLAN